MNDLLVKVKLTDVKAAPWRFSEDHALAHQDKRYYTPILENIARSLKTDGQISPIHVRLLSNGVYEIVDGHIVVDAARELGLDELLAIVHRDLDSDDKARLRYIHFNLNRCGDYGHYHVKIHRVFGAVAGDTPKAKASLIHQHVSWPQDRVLDYVELSERDANWQKFMYVPKVKGFFDDDGEEEHQVVPDYQL